MIWPVQLCEHRHKAALLGLVLVAACGGGAADDPRGPSPEVAPESQVSAEPAAPERVRLRIALLSEAPGLRTALREWGASHGAQVMVEVTEDPLGAGVEYSLAEVDAADLGDLAASQRIRDLQSLRGLAKDHVGLGAAVWNGRVYGIPWRGQLHGVGLPSPIMPGADLASWSALARLCQRLGGLAVVDSDSGPAPWDFLALSVGNGAVFQDSKSGELRLDPAEAVEALALLSRLHGRGVRLSEEREAVDLVASGGLSSATHGDVENWMGWPRPRGGRPVAWVQSRILCVPRHAPYFELVQQLLNKLSSAEIALQLDASSRGPWRSLHRSTIPDVDAVGLSSSQDQRRALRLWSSAVAAVLDRRRSPEAALLEAQESWMTAELHGP